MIAIEEPLKNSFSLEPFETLRKEVRRDVSKRLKQVIEFPTLAKDYVAEDENGPSIADNVQGSLPPGIPSEFRRLFPNLPRAIL